MLEKVVPGYPDAWQDANKGRYDRRRKALVYEKDRCMPIYLLSRKEKGDAFCFLNRGYCPVFSAIFKGRTDDTITDLINISACLSIDNEESGRLSIWFYEDSVPFSKRLKVNVQLCDYILQNAKSISPLWPSQDLTRSS